MERKIASAIMIGVLLISLVLMSKVRMVRAQGTIYIRADGSIDPPTAPISSLDNITYTFTDNVYDEIRVERSNIVVDGKGYMLNGSNTHVYGVYIYAVNSVSLHNVNVNNFSLGVRAYLSSFDVISGNTMANNAEGIELYSSSDNTIFGNNIANNQDGIGVLYGSNNDIYANNVTMNQHNGIYVSSSSSSNSIHENNVENNPRVGISVGSSNNNSIFRNSIMKGAHGIYISHSSSNNQVFENSVTESSNYGVYLSKSVANNISCNNIAANGFGVWLQEASSFNFIVDNDITANTEGIYLSGVTAGSCDNNSIFANRITANQMNGIEVASCFNNSFSENKIAANGDDGIVLGGSSNNTFHKNTIKDNNEWGIFCVGSSENRFYHNNLINNTNQASCSLGYTNFWDDGYPSGGNCWSDYTGADLYNGLYQNITGSDGIGDTPYIIDVNNEDRYPLMYPFGSLPPYTFALMISAGADGTTDPPPGTYTYSEGQNVPVQAIPNSEYCLDHWELDGTYVSSVNPYSVLMDENHTLHATFRVAIHDVAVTDVTALQAIVSQGSCTQINVTAENPGELTESFNVTVYANTTEIDRKEITLTSGSSATLTFTWNTTGFDEGNYTISAYAWPVSGETNIADNTFIDGTVQIVAISIGGGGGGRVPDME